MNGLDLCVYPLHSISIHSIGAGTRVMVRICVACRCIEAQIVANVFVVFLSFSSVSSTIILLVVLCNGTATTIRYLSKSDVRVEYKIHKYATNTHAIINRQKRRRKMKK